MLLSSPTGPSAAPAMTGPATPRTPTGTAPSTPGAGQPAASPGVAAVRSVATHSPGAVPQTTPGAATTPLAPAGAAAGAATDVAVELGRRLVENLNRVMLGTPGAVTAAAIAALSGGHLLIEDVPGVGKTVLAHALATSLGAVLSRVQGQPDLLPSDVTGVSVYAPDTGSWEFRAGPVFANVVLVDELNRTPPRTQTALLETMEERQVSVDGHSYALPDPHLVIATQNPMSQLGTYPLVESQLDRFALATAIGYPDAQTEIQLVLNHGGRVALDELRPICTTATWSAAQRATAALVVSPAVAEYAVTLCRATRSTGGVRLGASPRAGIWVIRTAQAHAVLCGRGYVTPSDVQAVAIACLAHRLLTDDGVERAVASVRRLLETTPAPRP